VIDYRMYKYLESVSTNFYRQLIINVVVGRAEKYNYLVKNFCQNKLSSCAEWKRSFGKKSYIAKLPMLMQNAQNYYHLIAQLSKCTENVVFIHNRNEMHNVYKKIIPKMSTNFRREYKYLSLTHDNFQSNIVFVCKSNNVHLILPVVRKYVEHGLYTAWAKLASLLKIRWDKEGRVNNLDNFMYASLDERFASIFFTLLILYAIAIFTILAEFIFMFCAQRLL